MRTVKSVLPLELWLTPKEPLESILKASMRLILMDITANGKTFTYFGKKCRISARTLNR